MLRFALPNDQAIGVAVGDIRKIAKQLGRSHNFATALWDAGWYEARMLACFVDDPAELGPAVGREAKCVLAWLVAGSRATTGGVDRSGAAVDRKGCLTGVEGGIGGAAIGEEEVKIS